MSKNTNINSALYDIIRTPVVTEKSTMLSEHNKVTFKVDVNATKADVKNAVEAIFSTKVVSVNIIKMLGKTKRFKGRVGKRNAFKKAIVTLAEGQNIDIMGGVS